MLGLNVLEKTLLIKAIVSDDDNETLRFMEKIKRAREIRLLNELSPLNHEEMTLCVNCRFVDAIIAYRNRTGISLKDSKDRVELFRSTLREV